MIVDVYPELEKLQVGVLSRKLEADVHEAVWEESVGFELVAVTPTKHLYFFIKLGFVVLPRRDNQLLLTGVLEDKEEGSSAFFDEAGLHVRAEVERVAGGA